jgi:hypothetical protein
LILNDEYIVFIRDGINRACPWILFWTKYRIDLFYITSGIVGCTFSPTHKTMPTSISTNYANYLRFANRPDVLSLPALVREPVARAVVTAEEYEDESPMVQRKRVCFGKEIGLDESIDVSYWDTQPSVSPV